MIKIRPKINFFLLFRVLNSSSIFNYNFFFIHSVFNFLPRRFISERSWVNDIFFIIANVCGTLIILVKRVYRYQLRADQLNLELFYTNEFYLFHKILILTLGALQRRNIHIPIMQPDVYLQQTVDEITIFVFYAHAPCF